MELLFIFTDTHKNILRVSLGSNNKHVKSISIFMKQSFKNKKTFLLVQCYISYSFSTTGCRSVEQNERGGRRDVYCITPHVHVHAQYKQSRYALEKTLLRCASSVWKLDRVHLKVHLLIFESHSQLIKYSPPWDGHHPKAPVFETDKSTFLQSGPSLMSIMA